MRRTILAVVTALAGLGAVGLGAPAAVADGRLVVATPQTVTVPVPAPGHSQEWTMRVRNVSAQPTTLSLAVDGSDSPLVSGATPLRITVVDDADVTVVPAVPAGQLLGSRISLDGLEPGEEYVLHGTVAMPSSAGNAYQGLSGSLSFTFVAQADGPDQGPPDQLAYTGASIWMAVVVAATFILLGAVALAARKRGLR